MILFNVSGGIRLVQYFLELRTEDSLVMEKENLEDVEEEGKMIAYSIIQFATFYASEIGFHRGSFLCICSNYKSATQALFSPPPEC